LNGRVTDPRDELRRSLLSPAEAELMDAHGATTAAVLLPLFGHPEDPGLVFTRRREDLRRHAGEVSFPGGRPDAPGEPLVQAALREASEEIALEPRNVEIVGALPPTAPTSGRCDGC
jgi:8-oxo-dGTP pyrophosphatase MutT (NUDIX family)